jgi:hypothetical protein
MSEYVEKAKNYIANAKQYLMQNVELPIIMTSVALFLVVVALFYYLYYTGTIFTDSLKEKQCDSMEKKYGTLNGKIHSAVVNKSISEQPLKNFFIKTAYNSCSGGTYKNDYVDLCVLKNILKQGVRGLDFELFSINNKPVVATSTTENYYTKESFNSIPFQDIMSIIQNYAFSGSTSPNPNDPIFIHLRIKSDNRNMFKNLAKVFKNYETILLGNQFSYENQGKNIGDVPISKFANKVVIIVDRNNLEEIAEYVNACSNSRFMRELHASDIEYMQDTNELHNFNKDNMTIAIPDKGSDPPNPNPVAMRYSGCQFIAMRYQLMDVNLEENNDFFDSKGFAFVLKSTFEKDGDKNKI